MPGLHVAIVTGLSGAGRSTAINVLEDLGFFCIDNLPPSLLPNVLELLNGPEAIGRAAFGIDVRTGNFLEGASEVIDGLVASGHNVEVIFLDASNEALVRRFSETRRPHPLAPGGDLMRAISLERERMHRLRASARQVIDTTHLSVHDLRRLLVDLVSRGAGRPRMITRVISFGFKYGLPVDADLVFDLRYLPNPHFVPELKPRTGLEEDVAKFVLESPDTVALLSDLDPMLTRMLPNYEREGKAYLTIAVGCTGGRHRSVAIAEELGKRLRHGREVIVQHRDVGRKVG